MSWTPRTQRSRLASPLCQLRTDGHLLIPLNAPSYSPGDRLLQNTQQVGVTPALANAPKLLLAWQEAQGGGGGEAALHLQALNSGTHRLSKGEEMRQRPEG